MSSTFEAVMDGLVERGGPGDQAPYLVGFGLADVEWGVAITPDTVFRIGSITNPSREPPLEATHLSA